MRVIVGDEKGVYLDVNPDRNEVLVPTDPLDRDLVYVALCEALTILDQR